MTTLYSFCSQPNCSDGAAPYGTLVQGANGDFYGTTLSGDNASGYCFFTCGTIFKITPSGALTTLYSFCSSPNCADGWIPEGIVQATNGIFYGTTENGGTNGSGNVFALSTDQAPFVETRPSIGKIGEAVTIIGYELTGATRVTFNGISAAFTVVSSTAITATVPAGAATGKVQVMTPDGPLSSNLAFEFVP